MLNVCEHGTPIDSRRDGACFWCEEGTSAEELRRIRETAKRRRVRAVLRNTIAIARFAVDRAIPLDGDLADDLEEKVGERPWAAIVRATGVKLAA